MLLSFETLIAVGIGGFFGAIVRFIITTLCANYFGNDFPNGTLIVNVAGSFLIGLLFAIFYTFSMPVYIKSFLTTGFLGALTTYSTFAMETFFLLNSNLFLGLLNIVANLFGTILAAGLGYKLTLYILKFF